MKLRNNNSPVERPTIPCTLVEAFSAFSAFTVATADEGEGEIVECEVVRASRRSSSAKSVRIRGSVAKRTIPVRSMVHSISVLRLMEWNVTTPSP